MITEILTNLIIKALVWLYERWRLRAADITPIDEAITDHEAHWPHGQVILDARKPGEIWELRDLGRPSVGIAQPPEMIPSAFSRLTEEELEDLWHGRRS